MKKTIIKLSIFVLLAIIVLTLYGIFISTKSFITNEIKIKNNLIENNFDGFKIVHLSDIYYGTTIKQKELKKIIEEVNLLKPDIVVITGDLISKNITYTEKDKEDLVNILNNIDSTIGNYAIKGDNDSNIWEDIINESNFINLNDTYNLIYNKNNIPIIISGISFIKNSNDINDKVKSFEEYIDNSEIKPCYSILLMHEPDYVKYLNTDNYNLILAGHSLGGLNTIIGRISIEDNAKKYSNGYYKIKNTDFYVSNGLGTNKIKYRLLNKPSINFYRIVK